MFPFPRFHYSQSPDSPFSAHTFSRVETHEVTEHHLQAALSSNQLAAQDASGSSSKAVYHIPTPDAKVVVAAKDVAALYPPGRYQDPVTYVRFSSTVEDKIQGPLYCLDEDDQDWLDKRNKEAREAAQVALKTFRPPPTPQPQPQKSGKGKDRAAAAAALLAKEDPLQALYRAKPEVRPISEDEFEMVMTIFEQRTSERCPMLHLDLSKIPSLEDLLPSFDADSTYSKLAQPILPPVELFEANDPTHPAKRPDWDAANPYHNLPALKPLAPIVYPWWVIRRKDRDGKNIVPVLNFDESNDNDPYVCFRRREVKTMRKTRKTDALHIEKLVRLRSELQMATELLERIAQREHTKRAVLSQDRTCWATGQLLLNLKRHWGIVGNQQGVEDDDLIFNTRKREEEAAAAADQRAKKKRKSEQEQANNVASGLGIKLTRKPRASEDAQPLSATQPQAATSGQHAQQQAQQQQQQQQQQPQGLGTAILERVQAVHAYIDREVLRKAEADIGYEEASDSAFQPMPLHPTLRSFRTLGTDFGSADELAPLSSFGWEDATSMEVARTSTAAGRAPAFRRRVGRGGRVYLDRRLPAPSSVPTSLEQWPSATKLSEVDQVEALLQPPEEKEQPVRRLTGPFAFMSDMKPAQLTATALHVSMAAHSATGPFARNFSTAPAPAPTTAPSSSAPESAADPSTHSAHSDASSTSSDWSDRSKSSHATSVSTQPTDVDEMEIDGLREEAKEQDEEKPDHRAEAERWTRLCDQWRYDDEQGRAAGLGLTGFGGMEEDNEAVIDDYDQRFLRYRMGLLEEADLYKLQTDLTHIMAAQAAVEVPMPPPPPPASALKPVPPPPQAKLPQAPQVPPQALLQQQQLAAQAQAAALAAASRGQAAGNNTQLLALQQQQQQFQLALQKQQQAAASAAAAAAAAAARSSSPRPGSSAGNNSAARNSVSGQGALPQQQGQQQQPQAQQPHPLSQSFSVNGVGSNLTPQQIQAQQAALMVMQQQAAAARGGANGQVNNQLLNMAFPNGLPMGANGQLQAALQGRSTPSPAPGSQANSSPNMTAQQTQQQRAAQQLLLQQQQHLAAAAAAAVVNGQNGQPGHKPLPTTTAAQAQMLAVQQALAQNPQMQLKLPPNRAMQLGQSGTAAPNPQAAALINQHMQALIAKQQAAARQQQQQAGNQQGRASPQTQAQYPGVMNMNGGQISPLPPGHIPSPAMAAAQLQQRQQGSPASMASPQMRGTPGPGNAGSPQRSGSQGFSG